jgi:hypothetical protein
MNHNYIAPKYELTAFNCPHCNAYAEQYWSNIIFDPEEFNERFTHLIQNLTSQNMVTCQYHNDFSNLLFDWKSDFNRCLVRDAKIVICNHCEKESFWINQILIYPNMITVPPAHPDMPLNVKELYDEARLVSSLSPRSAATLLRISLEKLTENLGEATGSLNTRISRLNTKGLPETVIKGLDIVRIYGNDSAHSNKMDTDNHDTPEIVDKLFWMVNYIVEKVITEPDEIRNMFEQLPESKVKAIENRDNNK